TIFSEIIDAITVYKSPAVIIGIHAKAGIVIITGRRKWVDAFRDQHGIVFKTCNLRDIFPYIAPVKTVYCLLFTSNRKTATCFAAGIFHVASAPLYVRGAQWRQCLPN